MERVSDTTFYFDAERCVLACMDLADANVEADLLNGVDTFFQNAVWVLRERDTNAPFAFGCAINAKRALTVKQTGKVGPLIDKFRTWMGWKKEGQVRTV